MIHCHCLKWKKFIDKVKRNVNDWEVVAALLHLLLPQPVLDVRVGGQDVGDVSEGHPCRVVSGDKDDEGGGAERYDVKVLVLPPKNETG